MIGKLKRFLHGVLRLKPWHITIPLFLVAVVFCVGLLWQGLRMEKEHTVTTQVWVPDNAISLFDLFGYPELRSGYQDSVSWEDTHAFGEYQKLDAAVSFIALVDDQMKYLAVLRNADGKMSVARTTVALGLPRKDIREMRTISFNQATEKVTAQYSRALDLVIVLGLLVPFGSWLFASALIAYVCRSKWNKPVFPVKRVSA